MHPPEGIHPNQPGGPERKDGKKYVCCTNCNFIFGCNPDNVERVIELHLGHPRLTCIRDDITVLDHNPMDTAPYN